MSAIPEVVEDGVTGLLVPPGDAGALAPRSMGYTIEYEMTIRAMKQRMKIVEISTIERPRIGGVTKGPSVRVGLAFLRFLLAELAPVRRLLRGP